MPQFLTPDELHKNFAVVQKDVQRPADNFTRHIAKTVFNDSTTIDLDEVTPDRKMGIYVAPFNKAETRSQPGYATRVLHPAYMKEKIGLDLMRARRRSAGGSYSPVNTSSKVREQLAQSQILAEERRQRLNEYAFAQVAMYGKYVAESSKHEKTVYDFGRDTATTAAQLNSNKNNSADLTTINANGGAGKRAWDSTGGTDPVSPIDDIQLLLDSSNRPITEFQIGNTALKYLKADPKFELYSDKNFMYLTSITQEGAPSRTALNGRRLVAVIGEVPIYTNTSTYQSEAGEELHYLDPTFIVGLSGGSAIQTYSIIQHASADYQALERFWHSWIDDELGAPHIVMQSAPTLVETDINSTCGWKVVS